MYKRGQVILMEYEEGDVRLALIISNDIGNANSENIIVVPLTHLIKRPLPYHILIKKENYPSLKKDYYICVERPMSKKKESTRIFNGTFELSNEDMEKVDLVLTTVLYSKVN